MIFILVLLDRKLMSLRLGIYPECAIFVKISKLILYLIKLLAHFENGCNFDPSDLWLKIVQKLK